MKKKIVVCDEDKEYVEAFSSYLMEKLSGVQISSFTSEEMFSQSEESYAIGILSKDFLSVMEFQGKDNIAEKLYLCDENIAPEYEHLPMVYKYQSMEIVEEMLKRMMQREQGGWKRSAFGSQTKMLGIYSPISHELSMPFGLAICQIYRERGSVLFLDIEELSIMDDLTGKGNKKSLMDLLYLAMQQEVDDIGDYVYSFMGIDCLSSFSSPEEMNDISSEAWERLVQILMHMGYDEIVILFGRTMQGFRNMVSLCEELIVLGKPGDFYSKAQNCFLNYANRVYEDTEILPVYLPMSAGNLVDGTYAVEELIQGNLGMFVRKMMQDVSYKQELKYGAV